MGKKIAHLGKNIPLLQLEFNLQKGLNQICEFIFVRLAKHAIKSTLS